MAEDKEKLKTKNFKLAYNSLLDRPVVIKLNRLAKAVEREPAEVYRMAIEKGLLFVAAQHGVDPSILTIEETVKTRSAKAD